MAMPDSQQHRTDRPDRGQGRDGQRREWGQDDSRQQTSVMDRQMPQSLEAERAVLCSLLLLPETCDEVALVLKEDDFLDDANRRIYAHMMEMHTDGQAVDVMLLVQRLRDSGEYEAIGGAPYLAEVGQAVATAAHAEHYAHIVREKATLRALIHAGTDILKDAYDPSGEPRQVLARAEEKVFAILEEKEQGKLASIRDVLHESLARIDARMKQDEAMSGVETGFDDFDEMTGGFHGSELIILAARPSMGKTALALNMVEHAAIECGKPTLFVSLEMAALELGDRLLCSRAKVNSHRLRNGQLKPDEQRRLIQTAAEISTAPLYIDDSPSRTMTEIAAAARRLKRREGLGLITIDYLQLIDPDNARDPRQEQVAKIARRLKGLARELDVPVLCLGQLNRQVESSRDNKPQLSHLRESGAIEQDADVVMFVHREEYYQTNEEDRERCRGEADLLIRKQRNGPVGDVKLTWLHDYTRFTNRAPEQFDEFSGYSEDF
ncbi:Replicative DNA helicase [Pseudobythopirellula maris]|uniref:Replicative DNA helicase n=1 Tax=Pseudobythopirellula maris TaxID=2527991 RepID=A0A5C5ZPY6_9BACT|nr:replicative DNA helicase [Pseudobythopirellula maris]TWT88403.1 Replicative DNA helicase [Pseudobythopirellula maris]